jgi:hypothetical protein
VLISTEEASKKKSSFTISTKTPAAFVEAQCEMISTHYNFTGPPMGANLSTLWMGVPAISPISHQAAQPFGIAFQRFHRSPRHRVLSGIERSSHERVRFDEVAEAPHCGFASYAEPRIVNTHH